MDFVEPKLTVRFELTGREFIAKSYSIDSAYTTSTDAFDFVLFDDRRENLRDLWMQPIELLIDGNSQLLGRIEVEERGNEGTAVACRGRDYIADLIECTCDPTLVIKQEMDLGTVLKLACAPAGIDTVVSDADISMRNIRTGVSVRNRKQPVKKSSRKVNDWKPNPDEGMYAFANRQVARQGATIQPWTRRNGLVIATPNYEQEAVATIVRRVDNPTDGNLILRASSTRDGSSFPSFVIAAGKGGAVGEPKASLAHKFSAVGFARAIGGELARVLPPILAPGRRLPSEGPKPPDQMYRLLCQRDEDSQTQEQVDRIAVRAFCERFKETLVYRVTVRGHSDPLTKAVWATDTIVNVQDEVCNIDEPMWVASRKFSFSPGQGTTTELEMWRPGSFRVDVAS